jgi:flagellar hook-associated protein 2
MVTRIGGLASGMDIDSIVEKLMQAEKAPLNKLQQQKQKYEWQRDAYRDVNTQLKAFDTHVKDNLLLEKDFWKKNVSTSSTAIKVSNINAADGASLSVSKVSQLASAGQTLGKEIAGKPAGTTTLADLGVAADANGDVKIKLNVLQKDGSAKLVEKSFKATDSIDSVVKSLNTGMGLSAMYDSATGRMSIMTNATGKGFSYEETTVDPDDPLATTKIQHDSVSVQVVDGGNFFTALGFNDTSALVTGGQNAKATINGLDIERSSNTFELNGFSVTLNELYGTDPNVQAAPISVTTSTDIDHMVDKIKEFVKTYNGLIESLNGKITEKKYKDYAPLTDTQREDMEKEDIEKWEVKAKSGILRSDSVIRNGLSSLRSILYESGGSSNAKYNTLYSMGVTTTSTYTDGGKLEIDEEKLRKALTEDPEAVMKTFSNPTEDNGIVQKLRKKITSITNAIESKAGRTTSTEQSYTLGKSLLDADKRIDNWKTKLETIEERYWKQFTAMEKAISKANEQSSTLFSGE